MLCAVFDVTSLWDTHVVQLTFFLQTARIHTSYLHLVGDEWAQRDPFNYYIL